MHMKLQSVDILLESEHCPSCKIAIFFEMAQMCPAALHAAHPLEDTVDV